jgi:hypothetical protein
MSKADQYWLQKKDRDEQRSTGKTLTTNALADAHKKMVERVGFYFSGYLIAP